MLGAPGPVQLLQAFGHLPPLSRSKPWVWLKNLYSNNTSDEPRHIQPGPFTYKTRLSVNPVPKRFLRAPRLPVRHGKQPGCRLREGNPPTQQGDSERTTKRETFMKRPSKPQKQTKKIQFQKIFWLHKPKKETKGKETPPWCKTNPNRALPGSPYRCLSNAPAVC